MMKQQIKFHADITHDMEKKLRNLILVANITWGKNPGHAT